MDYFKVCHSDVLTLWFWRNPILGPDPTTCQTAQTILAKGSGQSPITEKETQVMEFISQQEKNIKTNLFSESAIATARNILDFFRISLVQTIEVYVVAEKVGGGGTFCASPKPFIILRVPFLGNASQGAFWHEYIHSISFFSNLYQQKKNDLLSQVHIPQGVQISPQNIIDEGMAYVVEPWIRERKVKENNLELERIGIFRAWGKYREQTLLRRHYSSFVDIMESIPQDWSSFVQDFVVL
ncbi:MAG: hypothetical protein PHZ25_01195 [Candidatus Pacebacteria bacterium]|nr:hypothetical protein [Candidatus Paceibacterota bacterium]